jgi:hypothetical protein
MQATIQHQQRIAWDAALAVTVAARGDDATFAWCRGRLAAALGSMTAAAFDATRHRLADPSAAPNELQIQAGVWRVRLDDALRNNPAVAKDIGNLAVEVAARHSAH